MKAKLYSIITAALFTVSANLWAAPAPDFSLPTDNGTISLKDLRGKVVYLDFWASWCTPCRKSFPWMNEINTRYKDKGLVVLAVNLDEERESTKPFIKATSPNFTIAYDSKGESAEQYQLKGMPSSYLIDRNGELVSTHIGFRKKDKSKLEAEINSLLQK